MLLKKYYYNSLELLFLYKVYQRDWSIYFDFERRKGREFSKGENLSLSDREF